MSNQTIETSTPIDRRITERRNAVNELKRKFRRHDLAAAVIIFVALALVPLLPSMEDWMLNQGSIIIVYVIAAMGIMVLVGFTGLVSVGHGGFLAVGAYTAALLTEHLGTGIVVGILASIVTSAVIGGLLGLVFLRLSGPFMAIGTLGFAYFIGTIVNNVPVFQGRTGISLFDNHVLGISVGDPGFYYLSIICLGVVTLFIFTLINSGTGRAFMALRDSEKAAMASGVSRWRYRVLAFTISAAITGIAGALNAYVSNYVSAEVYVNIWYSVDILVAAVVGGSTVLFGPYLGGIFIVMLPFFLSELGDFAYMIKGVVLILVLRFAPAGIIELVLRPFKNSRRRKLRLAGSLQFEGGKSDD